MLHYAVIVVVHLEIRFIQLILARSRVAVAQELVDVRQLFVMLDVKSRPAGGTIIALRERLVDIAVDTLDFLALEIVTLHNLALCDELRIVQIPRLMRKAQLRRRHVLQHRCIRLDCNHVERHNEKVALRVSLLQVRNLNASLLLLDREHLHHLRICKHLHWLPRLVAVPVHFRAAEICDEAILCQRRNEREEVVLLHHEVVDDFLQELRIVVIFDRLPDDIDRRVIRAEYLDEVRKNPVNRRLDVLTHPVV